MGKHGIKYGSSKLVYALRKLKKKIYLLLKNIDKIFTQLAEPDILIRTGNTNKFTILVWQSICQKFLKKNYGQILKKRTLKGLLVNLTK